MQLKHSLKVPYAIIETLAHKTSWLIKKRNAKTPESLSTSEATQRCTGEHDKYVDYV